MANEETLTLAREAQTMSARQFLEAMKNNKSLVGSNKQLSTESLLLGRFPTELQCSWIDSTNYFVTYWLYLLFHLDLMLHIHSCTLMRIHRIWNSWGLNEGLVVYRLLNCFSSLPPLPESCTFPNGWLSSTLAKDVICMRGGILELREKKIQLSPPRKSSLAL